MKRGNITHRTRLYIHRQYSYTCYHCGVEADYILYGIAHQLNPDVMRHYTIEELKKKKGGILTPYGNWDITIMFPFEIDHYSPVFYGGDSDPSNLVLSCRYCNRSKGHKIPTSPKRLLQENQKKNRTS